MTFDDIEYRLSLQESESEAECLTAELMTEVKKRTGKRPKYRDQAPVWAKDFLKRRGYRI